MGKGLHTDLCTEISCFYLFQHVFFREVKVNAFCGQGVDVDFLTVACARSSAFAVFTVDAVGAPQQIGQLLRAECLRLIVASGVPVFKGLHQGGGIAFFYFRKSNVRCENSRKVSFL